MANSLVTIAAPSESERTPNKLVSVTWPPENDARVPLIRRLFQLGFEEDLPARVYVKTERGGRTLYARLQDDRGFIIHRPRRVPGAVPFTFFRSVEDLDLAVIYETLRDRRRSWPMKVPPP